MPLLNCLKVCMSTRAATYTTSFWKRKIQRDHKILWFSKKVSVNNSRNSLRNWVCSFLISSLPSLNSQLWKENIVEIENLNAKFKFMDIQIPYVQTNPNEISIPGENKCPDHSSPLKLSALPGGCSEISCNNGILQSWYLIVLDYCLAMNQMVGLGTDRFI